MNPVVRDAAPQDVPDVVRVHLTAFPGFFLTMLGPRFLAQMYAGFIAEAGGILLVAERNPGEIVGVLAGTSAPADFFGTLRRRRGFGMLLAAIPGSLRHPLRVAERMLAAARYAGDRPSELPGYWLLSSLGVAGGHAGAGVGTALVTHFCERAANGRAHGVYLLTDRDDNEATTRFYAKREFAVHAEQRRRDGRHLLVLARSFSK